MFSPSAYLLITHGSHDPHPQLALDELARLVRKQLRDENLAALPSPQQSPARGVEYNWQLSNKFQATASALMARRANFPVVGTATLELAPVPLHAQIEHFANRVLAAGYSRVQLLPLFLLSGVHVKDDIPAEVALAQQHLGKGVQLQVQPHVGSHPQIADLLVTQLDSLSAEAVILLSHGSRRPGGNELVEEIARQLGAVAAYWSISPTLEEQITALTARGYREIAILPYFLFGGGTTEAIAQQVSCLHKQFQGVYLRLGQPIGATAQLARLVVDLMEKI